MFDLIKIDGLLDERSPAPSGSDLEYDAAFASMEQAAQGKPEQQYGDTIIPGEPPAWKEVERHALDILDRSHDLRAAVFLATAALAERGLASFASVVGMIKGYIENYWETVNPVLDPEDDNDPTIRVNALMSLCDVGTTLSLLGATPLVRANMVGQFSLYDWRVANGELTWLEDSEDPKPELSHIQAAFQGCELEELVQLKDAAKVLLEDVKQIEDVVTDKVGSASSCNFETLVKELVAINRILDEQASIRAPAEVVEVAEVAGEPVADSVDASAGANLNPNSATLSVSNLAITTRREAINALDKVCDYFEQHEPSSPLPLLLKRARRLSMKSFLEIIMDISPDGMHQVTSLGGLSDEGEDSPGGDSSENSGYNSGESVQSNSPEEY